MKNFLLTLLFALLPLMGCDSKPPYNPWDYVAPTVGANIQFPSGKVRCIVPDGVSAALASGGYVVVAMEPQFESASYRAGSGRNRQAHEGHISQGQAHEEC